MEVAHDDNQVGSGVGLPEIVRITVSGGRVRVECGGKTFVGCDLDSTMAQFTRHFRASVAHVVSVDRAEAFHGFRVGQAVTITAPRTEKIVTASGVREGFPSDLIGRAGTILRLDRRTMSLNTVCLDVDGRTVWGSYRELAPAGA